MKKDNEEIKGLDDIRFLLLNIKSILADHSKPSPETRKMIGELERKVDERLPTHWFKWVIGTIVFSILGTSMGQYSLLKELFRSEVDSIIYRLTSVEDRVSALEKNYQLIPYSE